MAQAQNTDIVVRADECPKILFSQETTVQYLENADGSTTPIVTSVLMTSDTVPVWVIYMDSVRMYASYPDYDMRLKVAPGWRINLDHTNSIWVDQDGWRFNPDNVIMDRPRKPVRNPFKE